MAKKGAKILSRNFLESKPKLPDLQLVAFSGPRRLEADQNPFVAEVVASVLSTPIPAEVCGRRLLAGCAVGVDAQVIEEAIRRGLSPLVYTIMDETGAGGWKDTNAEGVFRYGRTGGEVVYLAGGRLEKPLGWRLRGRTLKMLDDLATGGKGSGLVAFYAGTRGTEMTIEEAIKRKVLVVVYPLIESIELPRVVGGEWVRRAGEGVKSRGFFFRPF